MKEGRFHVRVEEALLQAVKTIAKRRGVTVTFLVDQFFRSLVEQEDRPKADEELGVEQA